MSVSKSYLIVGGLEDCIRERLKDIEILAANSYKKVVTERIFRYGLDADNNKLGSYRSDSYKKKRIKAGRQVGYKDLQMTDQLRNNLDIGEVSGKTVVGITDNERDDKKNKNISNAELALLIEKQTGKTIFTANSEEVDIVFDDIEPEIDNIIKECLLGL